RPVRHQPPPRAVAAAGAVPSGAVPRLVRRPAHPHPAGWWRPGHGPPLPRRTDDDRADGRGGAPAHPHDPLPGADPGPERAVEPRPDAPAGARAARRRAPGRVPAEQLIVPLVPEADVTPVAAVLS